jgi:DNA repair exonuclease SbcCD ATPase subunit/DNA repair exonuclease SbcCD nuclease subunit
MIKIAHMADIHWRTLSRHDEYKKSFEDAFKKLRILKPDVILLAGDIVHSKTQSISPELISSLTWWFNAMAEIAEVRVTLGNHDGLILNPDREDAISPIIGAIDNPRIIIHKKSGVFPLDDDHNLCVFSCFDEANWPAVRPEDGKINIATLHGPVLGTKTDESWAIDCIVGLDFFDGFDYVMLGDIHRQQFLTPRIAYPGSVIQQNYKESNDKGFLFWGIEGQKFKTKHIGVEHAHPFVTLDYDGDLDILQSVMEENPSTSRVRVRIQSAVTQADMSQIRAAIKDVADPTEIVFKRELDETSVQISDEALDEMAKIDSFEAVNALVGEYYSKADLPEAAQSEMSRILAAAWGATKLAGGISNGRWSVRKMEFDNIFGYGEDNVVNFESANGITGIFGKNRSGKSSICGALTYALFNGTDRGAIKNVHVINARKGYCRAKVIISKKGQNYLIERQSLKKSNQKGDAHATTHLNLFECDETGTPLRDISEEQRRETEKILRDIVGNLDDFLLTSLASQGDINRFVQQGSAVRKAILAKFLRLDVLDDLLVQVKQELLIAKRSLREAPERQFDIQIIDRTAKLKARTTERDNESLAIEKISAILNTINLSLESQADEMYTRTEVDDQLQKIVELQTALEDLQQDLSEEEQRKETLQTTLAGMAAEIQDIDFEDIRKTKEKLVTTERDLLVFSGEIKAKATVIRDDKRAVKKLKDVPCEDTFPTCKYIVEAKKAETSMLEKKVELKEARKHAGAMRALIKKLLQKNVDEKLAQKQGYDEKRYALMQLQSQCDMSILGIGGRITNNERELDEAQAMLSRMRINLCSTESAKERNILVKKKKIAEVKLLEATQNVRTLSERIGLYTAEVKQLRKDKRLFEKNNQSVYVLTLLQKALSRDGIPLQIIKKKLPAINHEIANILQGVTGFTVELEIDKSSGMDIVLNYGDSRRVIECCSGMEKMMSSLAIRTALVRVSSLPKCDTLIIDEGFGALDASNVEACTALLRSLTKTFRLILIISHIDTVRDVVDNVIEISANSTHDAKVKFL